MRLEKALDIKVSWGGEEYTMDIAPIINAVLAFLTKLMNAYLPEEFNEILGE